MSTETKTPHKNPKDRIRRRPSRGRNGGNSTFENDKKNAKFYTGQKLPSIQELAKQTELTTAEIRSLPPKKRLRMSALLGLNESEFVGPSALAARVTNAKLKAGQIQEAKDIINAPFLALYLAEKTATQPVESKNKPEQKQTLEQLLQPNKSSNGGHGSIEQATRLLRHIEELLKTAPNCAHVDRFKRELLENEKKQLQNEILGLVQPNIETQREIKENLEKRTDEQRRIDSEIIEQVPTHFLEIHDMLTRLLEGQERAQEERQILMGMQEKMIRKNKEYHERQVKYVKQSLNMLARIDHSTDVRHTRTIGIWNAYGIKWIFMDVLGVIKSVFVDGQNEFSPSLKRPMINALDATITVFEVAVKWVSALFEEVHSLWRCFEAHPLTCIMSKLIKYNVIAVMAAAGYFLMQYVPLGTYFLAIIKNMGFAVVEAAKSIYEVGDWLFGFILGKAMKEVAKWAKEMGNIMLSWASEKFPSAVTLFTSITSIMYNIIATLKGAWKVIKSISTMGTGAVGTIKNFFGWNYVGDALMGPTFKQLLIADNLAFQQATFKQFLITDNLAFQKTVEETTRNEESTRNKPQFLITDNLAFQKTVEETTRNEESTRNKPQFKQLKF
jgi:hypothetical protein